MMSGVPHLPNLCFPNPRPAQPNPNKHTERHTLTHKLSTLNVSVSLRGNVTTQRTAAASGSGGPEKSLRAPSTVCTYLFSSHSSILSSLSLTLLCMTTTLWLSALSQVSMALQMLQILSRAGAWWSGQPKSKT